MIGIAGRAGGRCSYVLTKRLDKAYKINYCIKEIKNMGYEFKSLDEFEI